MSDAKRQELELWAARRVMGVDGDVPWTTLPKALQEVGDMLKIADGEVGEFLNEVRRFLEEMATEHQTQLT